MGSRILFVTGKGGTGRSTVATGLAAAAAARGERCILVRASASGESASTGRAWQEIIVDDDRDLGDFLTRALRFSFLARRLQDSRTFSAVAAAAPGLRDLVRLTAITRLAASSVPRTVVVVDAPATGHSVPLLLAPRRVLEFAALGPVARDTREALRVTGDPRLFTPILVTTPEELAITEVLALREELAAGGIAAPVIAVNGVWPSHLDEHDDEAAAASGLSDDAAAHRLRRVRQSLLLEHLEREAGPCPRLAFRFGHEVDEGDLPDDLLALYDQVTASAPPAKAKPRRVAGASPRRRAGPARLSPRPRARGQSLVAALAGKRLVVLVGEGGVGKTSTSAAVAYARAISGESVAVLTVDPAPRLGDALGLAAIDAAPQSVALPPFARGTLEAMRLDSKRTFDRMVERYSPGEETAAALLAHPLYAAVAGRLGGGENYAAFQRLHELVEESRHDCLVVDTPPAANARELFAAPARLGELLGTGALAMLADPAGIVARAGGTIARATLGLVLGALERATGSTLQRDVSAFISLFSGIVGSLEGRAREIDALLRAPATAFVMVTRPREADVKRALALDEELGAIGISIAAVVVNRRTRGPGRRGPAAASLASLTLAQRRGVLAMERDLDGLRAAEDEALALLREGLAHPNRRSGRGGKPPVVVLVDSRDSDISSLEDIAAVSDALGT